MGRPDDLRSRALALYKGPFSFQGGYLWDDRGEMVADSVIDGDIGPRVRGWGRMSYMPEAQELYAETGRALAEALTLGWMLLNGKKVELRGDE